MARILIIGACGYAGGELLRFLIQHPELDEITLVDKAVDQKEPVTNYYPQLVNFKHIAIYPDIPDVEVDLIFLATPDGVTMKIADRFLDKGVKVVDFSGDTRLNHPSVHFQWYKIKHTAEHLLQKAVYGLPEINREKIRSAELVANPGCYATSNILGLAPLAANGLLQNTRVICDSKSGISGAGRHPNVRFHLPEAAGNFYAYKTGQHKHTPEMEQVLSGLAGSDVQILFNPQVVPVSRGILSTIYCPLEKSSESDIYDLFSGFYKDEVFVRLEKPGTLPEIATVRATNFCNIGITYDQRTATLVVVSALDNLCKGASTQAVQNMNLLLGFEETAGLMVPATHP